MTRIKSGYLRQDGERYFTPEWVTRALLSREGFHGVTLDPAAGEWHMVNAMKGQGLNALGFDIVGEERYGNDAPDVLFYQQDFLEWDGTMPLGRKEPVVDNIVTNPPYGSKGHIAMKFIEHALALTEDNRGKVAFLLKADFDSARGRVRVFRDHKAFAGKHVLTQRIQWVNLEPKTNPRTGREVESTECHAWYVWDWSRNPEVGRYYGYLP